MRPLIVAALLGTAVLAQDSDEKTSGAQRPAAAPQYVLNGLARAETKWKASKIQAYEFRLQYACNGMIPPEPPGTPPILFRVNNGMGTSLRSGADPVAVPGELVHTQRLRNCSPSFARRGRNVLIAWRPHTMRFTAIRLASASIRWQTCPTTSTAS